MSCVYDFSEEETTFVGEHVKALAVEIRSSKLLHGGTTNLTHESLSDLGWGYCFFSATVCSSQKSVISTDFLLHFFLYIFLYLWSEFHSLPCKGHSFALGLAVMALGNISCEVSCSFHCSSNDDKKKHSSNSFILSMYAVTPTVFIRKV